jgi:hydrogenase nickel incorporation protein HypA/HybF
MIQALEFALDVAVKGTILEDAKRITRVVEAKGMCTNCSAVFGVKDFFATCPECKQTGFKLLKGRELRVKSILIG